MRETVQRLNYEMKNDIDHELNDQHEVEQWLNECCIHENERMLMKILENGWRINEWKIDNLINETLNDHKNECKIV